VASTLQKQFLLGWSKRHWAFFPRLSFNLREEYVKKMIIALVGIAFAATAYAADSENSEKSTVDHSKNPITGTKTTTKKWKKKVKGDEGKGEAEVKETTKEKTDGTVEKKVKVDSDTENK
jgi:hypothetical protein